MTDFRSTAVLVTRSSLVTIAYRRSTFAFALVTIPTFSI